ncbi:hypothetical protein DFH06DRAFT_1146924 [Mycena polygramma]|nr:hypothetical protein DFH06DRAFT_1146924 [Mycena polygramma]
MEGDGRLAWKDGALAQVHPHRKYTQIEDAGSVGVRVGARLKERCCKCICEVLPSPSALAPYPHANAARLRASPSPKVSKRCTDPHIVWSCIRHLEGHHGSGNAALGGFRSGDAHLVAGVRMRICAAALPPIRPLPSSHAQRSARGLRKKWAETENEERAAHQRCSLLFVPACDKGVGTRTRIAHAGQAASEIHGHVASKSAGGGGESKEGYAHHCGERDSAWSKPPGPETAETSGVGDIGAGAYIPQSRLQKTGSAAYRAKKSPGGISLRMSTSSILLDKAGMESIQTGAPQEKYEKRDNCTVMPPEGSNPYMLAAGQYVHGYPAPKLTKGYAQPIRSPVAKKKEAMVSVYASRGIRPLGSSGQSAMEQQDEDEVDLRGWTSLSQLHNGQVTGQHGGYAHSTGANPFEATLSPFSGRTHPNALQRHMSAAAFCLPQAERVSHKGVATAILAHVRGPGGAELHGACEWGGVRTAGADQRKEIARLLERIYASMREGRVRLRRETTSATAENWVSGARFTVAERPSSSSVAIKLSAIATGGSDAYVGGAQLQSVPSQSMGRGQRAAWTGTLGQRVARTRHGRATHQSGTAFIDDLAAEITSRFVAWGIVARLKSVADIVDVDEESGHRH